MNSIIAAAVVMATSLSSVALGVYAAHTVVSGILYAITTSRQRTQAALVPVRNHAVQ